MMFSLPPESELLQELSGCCRNLELEGKDSISDVQLGYWNPQFALLSINQLTERIDYFCLEVLCKIKTRRKPRSLFEGSSSLHCISGTEIPLSKKMGPPQPGNFFEQQLSKRDAHWRDINLHQFISWSQSAETQRLDSL